MRQQTGDRPGRECGDRGPCRPSPSILGDSAGPACEMRIPEDTIEAIRSASDVVDVVAEYVQLRQRGANHFGLCPFHAEKTASFSVNPGLGIYKCFGCGVAGDVFDFIKAVERVEFSDAARILAERAGITIPDEQGPGDASPNEAVYHALRFAARYYHEQLTHAPEGKKALAYLRERNLGASVIQRFGMGYAPDAWDALAKAAEAEHVGVRVLEQAGLVVPRRGIAGFYDRFRDRLIFPIISHVGKVVGFGGRILSAASDQPKYINSPETLVYHKGQVLFGLYQAKQAIRRTGEAILVEGYTDVAAMHQAGIENVIATSGTALTLEQVRLLRRYAQRIVLLYDADAAGDAATVRGLELLVESGLAPHAVSLPEGDDPDSFVRSKGGAGFSAYLQENRQDFVTFRYGIARRAGFVDTPDGQAEAVGSLLDLILLVDDPVAQESYLQRSSEVTGMPVATLWRGLDKRRSGRGRADRRGSREKSHGNAVLSARPAEPAPSTSAHSESGALSLPSEEALIRLMLEQGSWMIEFILSHMNLEEFSDGIPRRSVEGILAVYDDGAFDLQQLLRSDGASDVRSYLLSVLTDRESPSENWARKKNISVPRFNENALEAAAGAMTQLKLLRVQVEIERLKHQMLRAQQEGSDVEALQRERLRLHVLRKQIEAREFIQWPEYAADGSDANTA